MHSRDKQQQVMMPSPIAIDVFKATINCNGCTQCHHCGASKRLRNEPLKRDKKVRGNQPSNRKWPCRQTRQELCEGNMSIANGTHLAQLLS